MKCGGVGWSGVKLHLKLGLGFGAGVAWSGAAQFGKVRWCVVWCGVGVLRCYGRSSVERREG